MKKTIFIIVGLLFLIACSKSEKPQKIVIENRYSMEVPSFLVKATDLNKEASLQYQNVFLEFYVIVIDETKNEVLKSITDNNLSGDYSQDFNGYCKLIFDNYLNTLEIKNKSEISEYTINGLKAKKITIDGKYGGVEAYFYISLIEGKDTFYQIMTWTLQDKKDKYSGDMEKMVNTFREI
jgi:hypothetical protein